jgi:hypothetical protein
MVGHEHQEGRSGGTGAAYSAGRQTERLSGRENRCASSTGARNAFPAVEVGRYDFWTAVERRRQRLGLRRAFNRAIVEQAASFPPSPFRYRAIPGMQHRSCALCRRRFRPAEVLAIAPVLHPRTACVRHLPLCLNCLSPALRRSYEQRTCGACGRRMYVRPDSRRRYCLLRCHSKASYRLHRETILAHEHRKWIRARAGNGVTNSSAV